MSRLSGRTVLEAVGILVVTISASLVAWALIDQDLSLQGTGTPLLVGGAAGLGAVIGRYLRRRSDRSDRFN